PHDNSAENMYIQRAELDGQDWNNAWFHHDQLTDGGTLELWMGPEPNEDWGTETPPPSESDLAPAVPTVTPDAARVAPGESIELSLDLQNRTAADVSVEWQAPQLDEMRVHPDGGTLQVAADETVSQPA